MRKGQLEFIAILGIIVVIVVVAFYALQTGVINPVPASPDARLAQDSTANFIRNAAYDTLRKVSDNGGYLEPQASDAVFIGKGVAYWLKAGQVTAPDVQANIIKGITDYISANKDSFASSLSGRGGGSSLSGKEVAFGQPQTSVTVLDSQLSITVYMPTTVNGAQVPQPYVVSVPTKIGEVIEFSRAFAQQQAQNRYLEYFIISSVLMSPYDGPAQSVPTLISLTRCGDAVFKGWWDIKAPLEDTIKSTLAHTYMPDKYPMNIAGKSDYLKYAIPEVGGKLHFDLNVSFDVADGFSLTQSNFQMNPGFITAIATPIPMTGICFSGPVSVMYYLDFPTIVRVRDQLTGNVFKFAMETFIKDNMPGAWGTGGYQAGIQADICSNMRCTASVKVVDSGGSAVEGASVSFMGCDLGVTDAGGMVSANTPCGYGPLAAYKTSFDAYSKSSMISDGLSSVQISMLRTPVINANLYEAVVENQGTFMQNGSLYFVPTEGFYPENPQLNGINPINTFPGRPEIAYLTFYNKGRGQIYDRFFDSRTATISGIPEGEYVVGGGLLSSDWSKVYGGISQEFNITAGMDGTSIYIYLPYSYAFSNLDNTSQISGGLLLTSMLHKCGMGPISAVPYNGTLPCTKGIGEL